MTVECIFCMRIRGAEACTMHRWPSVLTCDDVDWHELAPIVRRCILIAEHVLSYYKRTNQANLSAEVTAGQLKDHDYERSVP